jgi:hypothetical protein
VMLGKSAQKGHISTGFARMDRSFLHWWMRQVQRKVFHSTRYNRCKGIRAWTYLTHTGILKPMEKEVNSSVWGCHVSLYTPPCRKIDTVSMFPHKSRKQWTQE